MAEISIKTSLMQMLYVKLKASCDLKILKRKI